MKPLRKPTFNWVGNDSVPPFNPIQTLDVSCYHCGRTTRLPAPAIVDADRDMWRERYESLMGALNQAVADCRLRHGDDPMRQDFAAWLLKVRKKYNIPEEGEEWKRP